MIQMLSSLGPQTEREFPENQAGTHALKRKESVDQSYNLNPKAALFRTI